jgi:AhpD family alkylhydroperoxidase
MQARINHPAMSVPGAMDALRALNASAQQGGVPARTLELVQLRASQVNGCEVCVGGHCSILRKGGETDERLDAVANWREASHFTEAERAAFGLAEAVTRLSDRPDPVPDAVWDEAARHYDEAALSSLLLCISAINVFNRLNVAIGLPPGSWTP